MKTPAKLEPIIIRVEHKSLGRYWQLMYKGRVCACSDSYDRILAIKEQWLKGDEFKND